MTRNGAMARLAVGVLIITAFVAIACAGHATDGAAAATPPPVHVKIWPHFLRPTKADYDSNNLTQQQRSVIDNIVASVPPAERQYVRWEMWYGDVIVFEVNPSQIRSDGRGYSPSEVINDPIFFVDPADGSVFAWPPDSSPRVYASRWDPTCRHPMPVISPPPGISGEHRSKMRPRLWGGFFRPAIVDYDSAHLDRPSRDLIDRIVGSLPTAESPNVRWLRDGDTVAVFEVTLAQFCPGGQQYVPSTVINEKNRFVSPTNGEITTIFPPY